MNEANKKKVSRIHSIILMVLAAVMLVLAFTPAITVKTGNLVFSDAFCGGSFTSDVEVPSEIKVGFGTLIDAVVHFKDFTTVLNIQNLEAKLSDSSYSSSTVAENLEKKMDKLTPEQEERIKDKLENDESFLNLLAACGAFGGFMKQELIPSSTSAGNYERGGHIVSHILGIISLIALLGMVFVFPIVVIISFIKQLIKFLVNLKKDDPNTDVARLSKFPFAAYPGAILFVTFLFRGFSSGALSLSLGMILGVIIWAVVNCLSAVHKFLFEADNKKLFIVKQAIALVSIFAMILLLSNVTSLGLMGQLVESEPSMQMAHYESLVEEGVSGSDLKDQVVNAGYINAAIIALIAFLGVLLGGIAVINTIERFGHKLMKLKTGEMVPYKAMKGLAIILLILAIAPVFFTVKSQDAVDEAYAKGSFKVWLTEFKEEGTPAYKEYTQLNDAKDALEEAMEDLEDEELEAAENALCMIEDRIHAIESKPTNVVMSIVAAVLFVVCDFAYGMAPKFFPPQQKEEAADVLPA